MPEERKPYNSAFCRAVECDKRHGNKCEIEECLYNHKWIVYWETYGVYPPSEE